MQYFEAGHRNGPCDGIGAVVKRMANNAVKRNKLIIQEASSFIAWAKDTETVITFLYVDKENANNEMRSKSINPVKGTLSVHSVFVVDNNTIATRNTSCFENCYFSSGEFRMGGHDQDDKWCKHSLRQVNADSTEGEVDTDTENMQTSNENIELRFSVGDSLQTMTEKYNGTSGK